MDNINLQTKKIFLYARKSTDEPERQVLSIEAQMFELREFAKKEGLNIVREFVESRTAKEPGRDIFNEMIASIEKNEAEGILAWHPDRLARNSVDGGQIIYLIDCGRIAALKFPQFWFEPTPQGKFMLNIAFGQSKYYVDSLSENTKRGLRQKVRRGEYPSVAPIGYINDKLGDQGNKKVFPDPERFKLARKMWDLFLTGNYTVAQIIGVAYNRWGLTGKMGKKLSTTTVYRMFTNPFYYGDFYYKGELYNGKHEPMITIEEFDLAQKILGRDYVFGFIDKRIG